MSRLKHRARSIPTFAPRAVINDEEQSTKELTLHALYIFEVVLTLTYPVPRIGPPDVIGKSFDMLVGRKVFQRTLGEDRVAFAEFEVSLEVVGVCCSGQQAQDLVDGGLLGLVGDEPPVMPEPVRLERVTSAWKYQVGVKLVAGLLDHVIHKDMNWNSNWIKFQRPKPVSVMEQVGLLQR